MSNNLQQWLTDFSQREPIPADHGNYLRELKTQGFEPPIIWDVGACVLHWYHLASSIWPQAQIYCFEANQSCEFLFQQHSVNYHIGVLSNSDRRTVKFWNNPMHPAGSSYYRENPQQSVDSPLLYTEANARLVNCQTLETIRLVRNWPLPNLLKMDVQGAELDVLQGLGASLQQVEHVILELQHVEWNLGAPQCELVINWMQAHNFDLVKPKFSDNGPDADYHFKRKDV